MFGSEAKSLTRSCPSVDFFPPGCCAVIPHKTKLNRSIEIMQYYALPAHVERPFFDIEVINYVH
jgi:hypothetical protein